MRFILAFTCLVLSSVSMAETVKMTGEDAKNICAVFRQIYVAQQSVLSTYPLAQVVKKIVFSSSEFEFSLGNADENIICKTQYAETPTAEVDTDVVRIVYNPEVSLVESHRTYSGIQLLRAYNVQGALADTICNQLEAFNVTEDQASLDAQDQVLFTFDKKSEENIFGLVNAVSADKYVACGTIGDLKTLQFQPVGFFW